MTSCYNPHKPGDRYLIAGVGAGVAPDLPNHSVNYRGEKKPLPQGFDPSASIVVWSGTCLGSSLAARSDDDIAFLRAWKSSTSSTSVLGQLNQSQFSVPGQRLPLKDATVTLAGTSVERKSVTDADGKFEFLGVAPGNYRIRFEYPDYGLNLPPQEIKVPKGGCGWRESIMPTTGRLRILVKNSAGQPVPNIRVDLLYDRGGKLDALPYPTRSNSAGIVDIAGLPGGSYLIAVNPYGPSSAREPYPATFYAGAASESKATRITLAPNEQRLELDFRLPSPLPTRKIFVRVMDTEGKPVVGATVFGGSSASTERTDKEGMATLEVLADIDEAVGAWKEFDTDDGRKPWVDWKRWRADVKLSKGADDLHVRIDLIEWKRNGDWKPF